MGDMIKASGHLDLDNKPFHSGFGSPMGKLGLLKNLGIFESAYLEPPSLSVATAPGLPATRGVVPLPAPYSPVAGERLNGNGGLIVVAGTSQHHHTMHPAMQHYMYHTGVGVAGGLHQGFAPPAPPPIHPHSHSHSHSHHMTSLQGLQLAATTNAMVSGHYRFHPTRSSLWSRGDKPVVP